MATAPKGIRIDPAIARAAGKLLGRRGELLRAGPDEGTLEGSQARGVLAGVDEALAALWEATLEQAEGA